MNLWILNIYERQVFYPRRAIPLFGKPNNLWIIETDPYWECRKATMLEF